MAIERLELSTLALLARCSERNAFVKKVEHKTKVTLGQLPAPENDRENYLFRQRALFATLLRGPAAELCASNINEEDAALKWDFLKRNFRTRFTDWSR